MIYLHFSIPVCYKRLSRAFHLQIFSHPAGTQCADCIMYLATNHFVSVWVDNCLSASSLVSHIYTFFSLNMSEHVSFLCFILCLFPSTCAPIGSAEPPTNTFLVAWPAHNLLIALPALPTHTLFWFAQAITFLPVYLYFWVWTCLYMFHSFVSHLSIPVCSHRLIRETMDHHPKGLVPLSWCTKSNLSSHLFVSIHSCLFCSSLQNPPYPVQVQLKWENTIIAQQWHLKHVMLQSP